MRAVGLGRDNSSESNEQNRTVVSRDRKMQRELVRSKPTIRQCSFCVSQRTIVLYSGGATVWTHECSAVRNIVSLGITRSLDFSVDNAVYGDR